MIIPSIYMHGDHHSPCIYRWASNDNRLRKSCGSAQPYRDIDKKSCERERFTMRMSAAAQCCRRGAVVGLYGQPPTRSTSLLARAPIVVCSRGSQQKYWLLRSADRCLKKVGATRSVCDEYTFFVLAKWLGIHLTRVHGPSSDQSALLEALISRFRF